jgi:DNA-binding transcriptional LysR family regulator
MQVQTAELQYPSGMDWRDLRIALAIDRHRTLARAGRALSLDPTTISRRISALEKELATPLFLRSDGAWTPTEAGLRVVETAARMAGEVQSLGHDLDDTAKRVRGVVRITAIDFVVTSYLAAQVSALRDQYPELELMFDCTEKVVPLGNGRADLGLRLIRPTEANVRTRRLATIPLGVYRRATMSGEKVKNFQDLVAVGPRGATTLPEVTWLRSALPNARGAIHTNSISAAFTLIAAGAGVGVLPCALADRDDRLEAVPVPMPPPPPRELWLAVPDALARTPRLRAVIAWIEEAVALRASGPTTPEQA